MEPNIPTSFIPKRPIESSVAPAPRRSGSVGLLTLITFVVVIGTGLAFAGVFLYQKQLVDQKAKLEQSIGDARDGIGTEFVSDMKRLDARISGVKELIKNHVVVTPIFEALEATTLRSVQYKDFGYIVKNDQTTKTDSLIVDLTGTAKNYATIALQSDAFSANKLIKNPVFSNLTVDDKSRTINFKLTFSVDIADLSYQTFIDSLNKKNNI
ncbi:MAG: hypothetical protein AAB681_00645 [Patescibacteria group bacterium]